MQETTGVAAGQAEVAGEVTGGEVRGEGEATLMMARAPMTTNRAMVLDILMNAGGEVTDSLGGATNVLHEQMQTRGSTASAKAFVNSLKKMEEAGLVERDVRGKRTYAIRLKQPRQRPDHVAVDHRLAQADRARGDTGADARRSGSEMATTVGGAVDYNQLAGALLNRCAELLAEADAPDVKLRLADALERSQRYSVQVAELGDELSAVKRERDALRKRVRDLEHNVNAMLKGGAAVGPGDRAWRALDRFMREVPRDK